VHPKQGYLFYSDWADKAACIGRALLDGSNHTIIVPTNNNKGQTQVGSRTRSTFLLSKFASRFQKVLDSVPSLDCLENMKSLKLHSTVKNLYWYSLKQACKGQIKKNSAKKG
jgi:hypothetical protein